MSAHALAGQCRFGPLGHVWRAYEHQLQRRPLLMQMTTSAVMWGVGDAIGQRLGEPHKKGVDCRRAALTAAFGGGFIGPVGHCCEYLVSVHL